VSAVFGDRVSHYKFTLLNGLYHSVTGETFESVEAIVAARSVAPGEFAGLLTQAVEGPQRRPTLSFA
jgi:hypothetical protein